MRFWRLFLMMLLPLSAKASVTLTVASPVTPPPIGAYVQVQLVNCASPTIVNSSIPVPLSQNFYFNGNTSVTFTVADNVTQIACSGNLLSYYTLSYVYNGTQTLVKSVELPPGVFNVANLAPIFVAPFNPGVVQGPAGPVGPASTVPGPVGPPGTVTLNSGATINGLTSTGPVSAPSLPGYQYPATQSVSINRDTKINARITPFDFGAVGMGTAEQGDECEQLVKAIQGAASPNSPTFAAPIDGGGRTVRCTKANALINLPRDGGDYLSTSSGTGAQVDITFVNGAATSCAVYGGSGYNPSATLMVSTLDISHQGSGAVVHALTNSSGIPSSCVVDLAGMHYPATAGSVINTVFAAGADGATGSIVLTSGTFATSWTATTGGNGYTTSPASGVPVGTTTVQCTSYPVLTTTVASGAVTGGAATAGSGCTYNGSSSATVPVCIGGCIGGVQATNIAPELPLQIGCAVPLYAGTNLSNVTIIADRPTGNTDLNQIVDVCDPWGDQGQNITLSNVRFGGMVGAWFAGKTQNVAIRGSVFGAQPYLLVTNYTSGTGSALGVYAPQMGSGTEISGNTFLGNAGVVCGGQWDSRTGGGGGLGSLGGAEVSLKSTAAAGGSCDGLAMYQNSMFTTHNTMTTNSRGIFFPLDPLDANLSSINVALDTFWEQYVWKTQNQPTADIYAPNGTGSCLITQTVVNRAIDYNFGNISAKASTYPFYPCYRGISMVGLSALSEYGYASQVNVDNFSLNLTMYRPFIVGSFINSDFISVQTGLGGRSATDPYTGTAISEGVISSENNTTAATNNFFNVTADSVSLLTHAISGNAQATYDVSGDFWAGVTPTTGQKTYGYPSVTYTSSLTPTVVAATTCADQTYTIAGLLTTDTIVNFTPPPALGSFPYPSPSISAANTLKLHWCNITASSATPVAGNYIVQVTH